MKTVLIVGGGGAGARLARALSGKLDASKHKLLLISEHPNYIHYPAGPRLIVTADNTLEDRVFIPYNKLFVNGNGEFKKGVVTAIETEKGSNKGGIVILETGEKISYDILALGLGSRLENFLTFPPNKDQTHAHIKEWSNKFREAKKVVIVGGGSVGLELAGEIREFYPETEVTIVHCHKQVLNATYPEKFRKATEKRIRAKGINLILDDYVDEFPATTTRKGTALDADLFIPARGPQPNTEFIARSLGSDTLNHGYVKIKPTMQLQSYPDIFAMGDIIDYPEQKQVTKCRMHVPVVAANILCRLKDAKLTQEYKGTFELILVTNGRNGGSGYVDILWGLLLGDMVMRNLKSKGLFIGNTRKDLGLAS